MKFFYYCFYRIHTLYVRKKLDSAPRVYSSHWVSFVQTSHVLTLIQSFCFIIDVKVEMIIILPLHATIYGINYLVLLTETKYKELAKKYNGEKHEKLKGWGVFLYLICSLTVWVLCTLLLQNTYSDYHFDFNIVKHFI